MNSYWGTSQESALTMILSNWCTRNSLIELIGTKRFLLLFASLF